MIDSKGNQLVPDEKKMESMTQKILEGQSRLGNWRMNSGNGEAGWAAIDEMYSAASNSTCPYYVSHSASNTTDKY